MVGNPLDIPPPSHIPRNDPRVIMWEHFPSCRRLGKRPGHGSFFERRGPESGLGPSPAPKCIVRTPRSGESAKPPALGRDKHRCWLWHSCIPARGSTVWPTRCTRRICVKGVGFAGRGCNRMPPPPLTPRSRRFVSQRRQPASPRQWAPPNAAPLGPDGTTTQNAFAPRTQPPREPRRVPKGEVPQPCPSGALSLTLDDGADVGGSGRTGRRRDR